MDGVTQISNVPNWLSTYNLPLIKESLSTVLIYSFVLTLLLFILIPVLKPEIINLIKNSIPVEKRFYNNKFKTIVIFLLIFLVTSAFFIFFSYGKDDLISYFNSRNQPSLETTLTTYDSNRTVTDEVKQIVKSKSQVIRDFQTIPLRKGYGNDTVIISGGEDCVSCHQNWLYVFNEGNQVIFETTSDDAAFDGYEPNSFSITQPIRESNESMATPSQYYIRTFIWNGKSFDEEKSMPLVKYNAPR